MAMTIPPTSIVKQAAADYLERLIGLLGQVDLDKFESVCRALCTARDLRAMVYVAGNGGSAATATHMVNDLCKATKSSSSMPVRAISLSDNLSWLTALANDEGYDRVFSGQLENFANPGDILVVISASGNSPNLVRAVEEAKEKGVMTIGLLGFDGGLLKDLVDEYVLISTERGAYELVEDCHMVLSHMLTTSMIQERKVKSDVT